MNILLDTHAFIWYVEGSNELSRVAILHIEDPANQCFVSLASLWEMSIKISLGKLDLKGNFETVLEDIAYNGFDLQPVIFEHVQQNTKLEWYHKDPFDRMLIAQCFVENMPIISRDTILDAYFEGYPSQRIW
jgi:PIN domain nuclease of toxin-antitoxin system